MALCPDRRGANDGTIGRKARQGRDRCGCEEGQSHRQAYWRRAWGITAPVTPSADLAKIVGKDDLPRSEVVSKVWEYIKKHDLQDPKDRRQINAYDKHAKVFGKKSASMFEMNKYLSAHLTAKKP